MNHFIPRLLLSAPSSGAGKTTLTCAILQALVNRGLKTASFKSGPDYIDPMFHSKVIGAPSRNLDLFLSGEKAVQTLLMQNTVNCDVAVLEGAMGYYDGIGSSDTASAYHLAKATKTPVVLIINPKGMSLSVCAQIAGFINFRKDSNIGGIIFNQIPPAYYELLYQAVTKETGIPVFGYMPPMPECAIASRHLGLLSAEEVPALQEKLQRLAGQTERTIDLDGLLGLANNASPICVAEDVGAENPKRQNQNSTSEPVRIGIAKDAAFQFYYEDSLELLQKMGAQLVAFSPLKDAVLPKNLHGLFLGGGYPELYAKQLSQNLPMRESILQTLQNGLPCYAECGGFLYLGKSIEEANGVAYPMVGLFDGESRNTGRLVRFGYVTLTAREDNLLCKKGDQIHAHEFHHWDSTNPGSLFSVQKASGTTSWQSSQQRYNTLGGFPHLHFCGNQSLAENFIAACRQFGKGMMEHDAK